MVLTEAAFSSRWAWIFIFTLWAFNLSCCLYSFVLLSWRFEWRVHLSDLNIWPQTNSFLLPDSDYPQFTPDTPVTYLFHPFIIQCSRRKRSRRMQSHRCTFLCGCWINHIHACESFTHSACMLTSAWRQCLSCLMWHSCCQPVSPNLPSPAQSVSLSVAFHCFENQKGSLHIKPLWNHIGRQFSSDYSAKKYSLVHNLPLELPKKLLYS